MVLQLLFASTAIIGRGFIAKVRRERRRQPRPAVMGENTTLNPPSSPASSPSFGALNQQPDRNSDTGQPQNLPALYLQNPIKDREIRILILKPGGWDDPIECDLELGNVDTSTYEALSYTWRAPPNDHLLVVNGIHIKIRENLFWALKYLRSPGNGVPRRIWVDAICIDQQGGQNPEKDVQIPLMGDIYGNATEVLVWLGKDDEEKKSSKALKHFEEMNDGNLSHHRMIQDFHENKEIWFDFGERLLSRDWFTRVWTVQEFIRATKLRFIWGQHQAPEELFTTIGLLHRRQSLQLQRTEFAMAHAESAEVASAQAVAFLFVRRNSWREGGTSLALWILQFCERVCGDPKDLIYGYIALDGDCPIKPNCKWSWQNLYVEATKYILERNQTLDFIFAGQGSGRDAELPSWVPDLRLPRHHLYPVLPRLNFGNPVYQASLSLEPDISFDGNILKASGAKLTRIESLSMEQDDTGQSIAESRRLAFKGAQRTRHRLYPTEHCHTYEKAFARTMVMDLGPDKERCGEGEGFREWDESMPVPSSFLSPDMSEAERRAAYSIRKFHQERMSRLGRRFATIKGGYMGLVPYNAQIHDLVVVLKGASMPVLLRDHPNHHGHFTLVGACYVHGFMDGELFRSLKRCRTFVIR
ncbi:heterokaryon incompatibility protein-domain-containing protein [Bisporella sp. PMI_857]|nr:heterokaryon incompatibility protein-domain-containing protein [Bisporella sp. PMI_857]